MKFTKMFVKYIDELPLEFVNEHIIKVVILINVYNDDEKILVISDRRIAYLFSNDNFNFTEMNVNAEEFVKEVSENNYYFKNIDNYSIIIVNDIFMNYLENKHEIFIDTYHFDEMMKKYNKDNFANMERVEKKEKISENIIKILKGEIDEY
jgi:hypothetical protein